MSNQIIYSLIVRKKTTILCEFSEHSGNFQQITLKIIKKALGIQQTKFRSLIPYDDYFFYVLSIDNIFIISLIQNLTDNLLAPPEGGGVEENSNIFSFNKYLYDKMLVGKTIEEINKAEAFSLEEFVNILKLSMTAFNIKPESFNDKLNDEEFPLEDIHYEKNNRESRLSVIKNNLPIVDNNDENYEEIIEKLKEENDTKSELIKGINEALVKGRGSIKKKRSKKKNKKKIILISIIIIILLAGISLLIYYIGFH